nr:MAG TPA: hypothetical protein [Caudoviricetes sp.]
MHWRRWNRSLWCGARTTKWTHTFNFSLTRTIKNSIIITPS